MFSMRRLLTLFCVIAAGSSAESAVVSGRVIDRAGHTVAHARIRAFHNVPLIEIYDRQHPPWDGLLGQTYSDAAGSFTVRTTGRASFDYLLVEGRGYFDVILSPLPPTVRVVLRRKVLSPEEQVRQLLKRLHRQTPKQSMKLTAGSRAVYV
jgi:hypothetical protein